MALLSDVATTALACRLIAGLPLTTPIDVYRLDFPLEEARYAVHVSADGSMVQPCDERFLNSGAGTLPVPRENADSDGDSLTDSADHCPQIPGVFASDRPGCPRSSADDRDGDGTADSRDRCPVQAGASAADGCALLRDDDGDGVPDHIDICSGDFGVIQTDFALGCPADASGSSTYRRGAIDLCRVTGDATLYANRADEAEIIGTLIPSPEDPAAGAIIGRTAGNDWYQLANGWVKRDGLRLSGACYNIPLVNAAIGGATGCFMRPQADLANVREAPGGKHITRIYGNRSHAVLGRNFNADWLFFREGWVNRAVMELSGSCDQLPALDPAKVAAGTVYFCPPGYTGLLQPRIGIGETNARIASELIANRLRAGPDISEEQIGEIPPGSVLDAVLDGPACNGPYIWWQVEAGGLIGWTVESDINANYYYLEPVVTDGVARQTAGDPSDRRPSEQAKTPAQRIIHSANAAAVDTVKILTVDSPRSLAWSPLASSLAVVSGMGAVAIYSYPDFAPITIDPAVLEAQRVTAVAFSPDEHYLAIGAADGSVTIATLVDGQPQADAVTPGELASPVRALAWSRNGERLAAISGDESLKLERRAGSLKLWELNPSAPTIGRLILHYSFPYPLTALAFSTDDRLLAVTGESSANQRAAIWIYRVADGELLFSKALVSMRGRGWVIAAPDAALGDFIYSNGDSLYQIAVDSGEEFRIYHQAGMLLPQIAVRRQVIPGAEALIALTARARNGSTSLRFVNALNAFSPETTLNIDPAAIAISPDGRTLAVAETNKDRILILGVTED